MEMLWCSLGLSSMQHHGWLTVSAIQTVRDLTLEWIFWETTQCRPREKNVLSGTSSNNLSVSLASLHKSRITLQQQQVHLGFLLTWKVRK